MSEVRDFIRQIVDEDLKSGKHEYVVTRFPPEPNGYPHIGHAKSICLNFGIAGEYPKSRCHLRFDDTDPVKEDQEYVDAMKNDIRWLGFDWGEHEYHASDYYQRLYEWAIELIQKGKAYVCHLSEEEMRLYRGTVTEPGKPSPYRDRSVQENLELLEKMRSGEFVDGACTLRARIDMASPNMKMRDPPIYRIKHAEHHRTGNKWCIYPLYDFAHPLSDAIEHITHSLCTLEFENNRELYDWFIESCTVPSRPRQIEFARLNLTNTVMSKRKLLQLVNDGNVSGWDDPRMLTISGLRRRGYTPESIRKFCDLIGVGRAESIVEMQLLEHAVRDDLNQRVPRAMAVLRPLKVVIDNYPEGREEDFDAPNFPDDPPRMGSRNIPFSRELYVERDDFMESPHKQFYRLSPGKEVRLRWAYIIRCESVVKDEKGEVVEVHCSYDPDSRGGSTPAGRKVKGTLHWVSARHSSAAEVRLYDKLFNVADPDDGDFKRHLNPDSLVVLQGAKVEPVLAKAAPGGRFQFERQGYFCADLRDSKPGRPVFNRTVALRDGYAKAVAKSA